MKNLVKIILSFYMLCSLNIYANEVKTKKKGLLQDFKAKEAWEKTKEVSSEIGEEVSEKTQEVIADTKDKLDRTRQLRAENDFFVLGNYAPVDFLIPSKLGFTLGYNSNQDTSWELEFLQGSVSVPFVIKDLGKMTDRRISVIRRSYLGNNSFNISYGLSYFDFSIKIGDELLNRVSGNYPSLDVLELQSLGFNVGVGNRWQVSDSITFGIDWFSWSQPVLTTRDRSPFLDYATNPDDRKNAEDAKKWISYFPRLSFLKLQLGILF
jgi:hypothetical protein